MEESKEKRYAADGCLIVSELWRCEHFEKDASVSACCGCKDCFFCKFSDFRKREYIDKVESEARRGILYSVCHNAKNKLSEQRRKIEQ